MRAGYPIPVGGEAFVFVHTKPTPSGRMTLLGAARVRVESYDPGAGVYRTRAIAGSEVFIGAPFEFPRRDLYAVDSSAERAAFGDGVHRFWPDLLGLKARR